MIGFWLLLAIIDLLKLFVNTVNYGRSFDWGFSLTFVSLYALTWIILSYPIYQTFLYFNRRSWPVKILTHLLFSTVYGAIHVLIVSLLFNFSLYDATTATTSFWDVFTNNLAMRFIPSWVNSMLAYWMVLIILFAFDYYQKYQQKTLVALQLESQLTQAKLQTLKMQLQPHFLFNAHNTISMLVRTGKSGPAVNMISALSDLLRTSLTRADTQLISLSEEIDLLKKYLKIEQARFEDRLTIEFSVSPNSKTALVPNLLLQPIVENAFKHGISRQMGNGKIQISVAVSDGNLLMTVYNSGPALENDLTVKNNSGIGLSNTRSRLQQLYPGNHQLRVENAAGGVQVTIKIPHQEKEENVNETV